MSEAAPHSDLYGSLLGMTPAQPAGSLRELDHALTCALSGGAEPLRRLIAKSGLCNVDAGMQSILAMAEDVQSRDRFLGVLAHILTSVGECADPDLAVLNLDRFARASFDRRALFTLLRAHPVLIRFFLHFFSFSPFLSDILIRYPEYMEWLLRAEVLDRDLSAENCRDSLARAVAPFRRPETLRRAVCRWKRRQLLRIGVRDMLGKADIRQTGRELTWLAEAIVELALRQARVECEARYGIPLPETAAPASSFASPASPSLPPTPSLDRPTPFAVYGMGKLGGEDLNFSSDIDLVFLYGEEGRTTGAADPTGYIINQITNHEYFTRLGERLIALLSEPSEEGLLFRVDMRLRPEGKSGPLARSLASYQAYFIEQARDWEKVAYLKARCIAGDEPLAREFDKSIASFVFTNNDPARLLDELARLKQRIDNEVLESEERERDLKRGIGGIREIEFIVSAHQLLSGAKIPALRIRPTPEILERLVEAECLPGDEAEALRRAYAFLRRLENRLQMMAERQTYLLPDAAADWGRLARRSGCREGTLDEAGARLRGEFQAVSAAVRESFLRRFHAVESADPTQRSDIDLLLDEPTEATTHRLHQRLAECGFREPVSAAQSLRVLALGSREVALSSAGQQGFERILPAILQMARRLPYPDAAVLHLDGFLKARQGIALIYELLAEHPALLRMLLRAFASGPLPPRALIAHPEWFDEIVSTGLIAPGFEVRTEEAIVTRKVLEARDDERAWRALRLWKEKITLLLMLLEVLHIEPPERLARLHTDLAEVCLRCIAQRVQRRLEAECGIPRKGPVGQGKPLRWTLLGLGGLGGAQVSHFSDLDVVLIFSAAGRVPGREGMKALHWFSRLGEDIIGVMSAVSPEGQLFKVDARLRPEGRNAPLAAPLDRYVSYYTDTAQTWEWQAILKARHVAGDADLAADFLAALWKLLLARFPDPAALAEEVRLMRRRLLDSVKLPAWAAADYKRGRGGLVDMDFILQFLQLRTAAQSPPVARAALLHPTPLPALEALVGVGVLDGADAETLRIEHDFLRLLQRRARLLFETAKDFFPAKADRLDPLRRALADALEPGQDLVARFQQAQARLAELFERLVR